MNRLIKSIALCACVLLVATMLCGCANTKIGDITFKDNKQQIADSVNLTLFGINFDSFDRSAMENLLHGFMNANSNIVVTYEGVDERTYIKALDKRIATERLDDVFVVDRAHARNLIAQNKLLNLSSIPTLYLFSDQARSQFERTDGKTYLFPIGITSYGLFVNYKLLDEHNQIIPQNYQELTKVCNYFVSQNIVPFVCNNTTSLQTLVAAKGLYPVYQQNTASEITKLNNGSADLVSYLENGLELVADMIGNGWIDTTETQNNDTADAISLFVKGKRPFLLAESSKVHQVNEKMGASTFEFGVFPYPVLATEDNGLGYILALREECVGVNAQSPNKDQAVKLLAYTATTQQMWSFCNDKDCYSPIKSSKQYDSAALRPSANYLDKNVGVFVFDYRLDLPIENLLLKATAAMLDGASASEAAQLMRTILGGEA